MLPDVRELSSVEGTKLREEGWHESIERWGTMEVLYHCSTSGHKLGVLVQFRFIPPQTPRRPCHPRVSAH